MIIDAVTTLNESTLIPIGVFVGAVTVCVGFATWLNNRFNRIDARLDKIEDNKKETWSRLDHQTWAYQLRELNPTLRLPTFGQGMRSAEDAT